MYRPPDLNRNITEVFKKLIDIYRGEIQFCVVVLHSSLLVVLWVVVIAYKSFG